MAQFELGSVSTGTLRTQDLLESFASALNGLYKVHPLVPQALDLLSMDDWSDEQSYQASDITEEISDALNELCPPFVYFGLHPGDGADYGFWPDMDGLEEAMSNAKGHACCLKLPDDSICLPDDGVVVQVSDHGNVTVMDRESNYHVIWSVV